MIIFIVHTIIFQLQEKLEVVANIEKVVYSWAESTHGLILKTGNDSFIYVFEQKYLPELEKSKFPILDEVKSVDDSIPTGRIIIDEVAINKIATA